jgi:2-oxoglutarate decarboxylase
MQGDARGDLSRYPEKAELIYVQEEPRNMGSYLFVADRMEHAMGLKDLVYIGRAASSSPAVGSKRVHKIEQERSDHGGDRARAGVSCGRRRGSKD